MIALCVVAGLLTPVFPTTDEQKALKTALDVRIERLLKAPCPSPLSAGAAPQQAHDRGAKVYGEWLTAPPVSVCHRLNKAAKRAEPERTKVPQACHDALASLSTLEKNTSGCTVGAAPDVAFMVAVDVARGLAAAATAQAAKTPVKALMSLLQIARMGRLAQANGTLIAAAVGAAIEEIAYDAALKLPVPKQTDTLVAALQTLLKTRPELHRVMMGEGVHLVLTGAPVDQLIPGWKHPEGWSKGHESSLESLLDIGGAGGSPAQSAWLLWWAIDQSVSAVAAACPEGRSGRECVEALDKITSGAPPGVLDKVLALGAAAKGDGALLRAFVVRVTDNLLGLSWGRIGRRILRSRFTAQALLARWQAPSAQSKCPATGDFLQAKPSKNGLILSPVAWLEDTREIQLACRP